MLESYNRTQTRRRQSWKCRKFKQMRLCTDFHAGPSKNLLFLKFLFLVSGVSRAFDRHPLPKSTALVGLGPSIKYTYVVGFLCALPLGILVSLLMENEVKAEAKCPCTCQECCCRAGVANYEVSNGTASKPFSIACEWDLKQTQQFSDDGTNTYFWWVLFACSPLGAIGCIAANKQRMYKIPDKIYTQRVDYQLIFKPSANYSRCNKIEVWMNA